MARVGPQRQKKKSNLYNILSAYYSSFLRSLTNLRNLIEFKEKSFCNVTPCTVVNSYWRFEGVQFLCTDGKVGFLACLA